MSTTHRIENFRAGCQVCKDLVARVKKMACPFCEVIVLDRKEFGSEQSREKSGNPVLSVCGY